ncbi:MAG: hypothetical protein QM725_00610 [Lacibacter sp.]
MKVAFMLLLVFVSASLCAQQTATTKDGKEVILNEDGTWKFVIDVDGLPIDTTSVKILTKPTNSQKLIKSERNNFGVWYNEKKWLKSDFSANSLAEFQLINQGKFPEVFCMIINERVEGFFDMLKNMVIENAKKSCTDFELYKQEIRTINQIKVLHLIFGGKIQGMQVKYFGYYATTETGITQLVLFTTKNLFNSYEKDFEDFANGLVLVNE